MDNRKVAPEDVQGKHMIELAMPFICMMLLTSMAVVGGIVAAKYLDNIWYAYYLHAIACVSSIITVVVGAASAARIIEYDRLTNFIFIHNIRSVMNSRVNALHSHFYHTKWRRKVLALGLASLKSPPGEPTAFVDNKCNSFLRLSKVRMFSKEWFKHTFIPAGLY